MVKGTLDFVNFIDASMELEDTHVFFTGRLLSFNESGGVLNANNKASSNLRIEGTRMSGLLDLKDLLNPGDDFVRRRVGGLIEVDNTIVLEDINGSLSRRVTTRKGSEMASFNVEFLEVLEEKRPVGSIELGRS